MDLRHKFCSVPGTGLHLCAVGVISLAQRVNFNLVADVCVVLIYFSFEDIIGCAIVLGDSLQGGEFEQALCCHQLGKRSGAVLFKLLGTADIR